MKRSSSIHASRSPHRSATAARHIDDFLPAPLPLARHDLARIAAALIIGIGAVIIVPQLQVLGATGSGQGCAVGQHSLPVGDHSKPCPTPPGCAIGNPHVVGDHSKPCPTPPGCAIGNPHVVGEASKRCPTP